MTFGAEIWGPPAIAAIGSIGGGLLSSYSNKETKTQKQQRQLIDELIASLNGGGQFGELFNTDENAFQKSFVDPAKSRFRNQIAPAIQQQYVGAGQEGSSGLNDQLLRAGVDMDQLLNQQYMDFINQGMNRKSNTINSILNAPQGVAQNTFGQNLAQAGSGYLESSAFQNLLRSMSPKNPIPGYPQNARPGYKQDWQNQSALGANNTGGMFQ